MKIVAFYLPEDATKQLQALAAECGLENPRRPGTPSASALVGCLVELIREKGPEKIKVALLDLMQSKDQDAT